MRRQGAAVAAALHRADRPLRLTLRVIGSFDLFDPFERKQQLIFRQGLGPAAEAMTLQFLNDLTQPLALSTLGQEHGFKQVGVVGQSR
jgi:hypothetical protein